MSWGPNGGQYTEYHIGNIRACDCQLPLSSLRCNGAVIALPALQLHQTLHSLSNMCHCQQLTGQLSYACQPPCERLHVGMRLAGDDAPGTCTGTHPLIDMLQVQSQAGDHIVWLGAGRGPGKQYSPLLLLLSEWPAAYQGGHHQLHMLRL